MVCLAKHVVRRIDIETDQRGKGRLVEQYRDGLTREYGMPVRKFGAAEAFRRTEFICKVIRVSVYLPAIRILLYGFRGRYVQSLSLRPNRRAP